MESLKDFGEVVITIQACVIKKFLQGFMAPKQKKKKKAATEETGKVEEVDEEKKLAEEARVRTRPRAAGGLCTLYLPLSSSRVWFLSGGHGGGEVEGRHQGGADLLPHARPAGNVGRLHQVGHVGRERPLQSLPQEG